MGLRPEAPKYHQDEKKLAELHARLQQAGGPLAPSVSLEELQWAAQLVLSRAFTSTIATPAEVAKRAPPPTRGSSETKAATRAASDCW